MTRLHAILPSNIRVQTSSQCTAMARTSAGPARWLLLLALFAMPACVDGFEVEDGMDEPAEELEFATIEQALAGAVRLSNASTGKLMQVDGANTSNNALLSQWTSGNYANGQFLLQELYNGYYNIIAVHSNKCLDLMWGSSGPGTPVQQYTCFINYTSQQFVFVSVGLNKYQIRPRDSGLCLEVFENSLADGYRILQNHCSSSKLSQQWQILPVYNN